MLDDEEFIVAMILFKKSYISLNLACIGRKCVKRKTKWAYCIVLRIFVGVNVVIIIKIVCILTNVLRLFCLFTIESIMFSFD